MRTERIKYEKLENHTILIVLPFNRMGSVARLIYNVLNKDEFFSE